MFYNAAYAMVWNTGDRIGFKWRLPCKTFPLSLVRGIGSSCSIMLGNRVGRNEVEQAQKEAKRFVTISLLLEWSLVVFKA